MPELEKTTPVMDAENTTNAKIMEKEVQKEDATKTANGAAEKAGGEDTGADTANLKTADGKNGTEAHVTDEKTTDAETTNAKTADAKSSDEKTAAEKSADKRAENGGESGTADGKDDKGNETGDKPSTDEIEKADTTENGDPEIVEVTATKKEDTSAKSAGQAVEQDLGNAARAHYEFALPLVTKSPNLETLEKATERLVKALQAAPEEKSTTRGYGELALLYGRALLGFVVRGAAEGDVLGGKAKAGDDEEEETDEKEETEKEKEDTTEELCWTQLEVARLAFQKTGSNDRLSETVRTIGEFLLACDQASAAGEEFGTAAKLCDGRMKAECLYKRYLSLRRVSVDEARESLREAIQVMSGIAGTDEIVKEMDDELCALPSGEGKGVKRAAEVTVTRVTPKRKK